MSSKVYDSMPECDRVLSFFLFKSYSALFPLLSTHGLKFEVGRLFMSANQYLLFLSFPEFCCVLFYLFYVPLPAWHSNPCLCIWVTLKVVQENRYERIERTSTYYLWENQGLNLRRRHRRMIGRGNQRRAVCLASYSLR